MTDDMSRADASAVGEATQSDVLDGRPAWQAGVIAGIVGAAAMGVLVSVMAPQVLQTVIPAMYTLSGGVIGWTLHLSHGAVIGVGFATLLRLGPFGDQSVSALIGLGLLWGVLVWVGLAALIMPVWLMIVGFPMSPMVPNFAIPSLFWHLVYGLVLSGTYYIVT